MPSCTSVRPISVFSNGTIELDRLPVRVVEEADEPQQGDHSPFVHRAAVRAIRRNSSKKLKIRVT